MKNTISIIAIALISINLSVYAAEDKNDPAATWYALLDAAKEKDGKKCLSFTQGKFKEVIKKVIKKKTYSQLIDDGLILHSKEIGDIKAYLFFKNGDDHDEKDKNMLKISLVRKTKTSRWLISDYAEIKSDKKKIHSANSKNITVLIMAMELYNFNKKKMPETLKNAQATNPQKTDFLIFKSPGTGKVSSFVYLKKKKYSRGDIIVYAPETYRSKRLCIVHPFQYEEMEEEEFQIKLKEQSLVFNTDISTSSNLKKLDETIIKSTNSELLKTYIEFAQVIKVYNKDRRTFGRKLRLYIHYTAGGIDIWNQEKEDNLTNKFLEKHLSLNVLDIKKESDSSYIKCFHNSLSPIILKFFLEF